MRKNTNQLLITASPLRIFLFLTRFQQEHLQEVIQFLAKHKLLFRRNKNEKQINASGFLCKNANYIAESIEPITPDQFLIISDFLYSKTLVIGILYKNQI